MANGELFSFDISQKAFEEGIETRLPRNGLRVGEVFPWIIEYDMARIGFEPIQEGSSLHGYRNIPFTVVGIDEVNDENVLPVNGTAHIGPRSSEVHKQPTVVDLDASHFAVPAGAMVRGYFAGSFDAWDDSLILLLEQEQYNTERAGISVFGRVPERITAMQ